MGSWVVIDTIGSVAVVGDKAIPIQHNTAYASSWFVPKTWRDYLSSAQKSLWRTAMELKMEQYIALNMWRLWRQKDLPPGVKILRTLWAFNIKFDGQGVFQKLNPRWCIVGTGMDRDIYDSFSDVMRWETLLLLVAIRANYKGVVDFHFDVKDAFQATRTDTARSAEVQKRPPTFCYQAPGFVQLDTDGIPYVLEVLTAHQGQIDSARLFGQEFSASCLRAGCYRATWDNELWLFHHGPQVQKAGDLAKIIAMSADMPAVDGAPVGFAAFGRHVDDGMGIATSAAVVVYLQTKLQEDGWTLTISGWEKTLGYTCEIKQSPDSCMVTLHCLPYLQRLKQVHLESETVLQPKLPYPSTILQLAAGCAPADGSPEQDDYLRMQEKCRSALGASIWAERVHTKLAYPVNFYCAFMSNPSAEIYKAWKQTLMHELAFPSPTVFGGYGFHSLAIGKDIIRPFTDSNMELGLHAFFDSNLGAPRSADQAVQGPISQGSKPTDPPAASRSVTGGVLMLGGGPVVTVSQRQHITTPDSTTAEITAGGTILHRVVPLRGLLQELHIPQLHPTPVYSDSQSAIHIANNAASANRSVWVNRRSAVLREGVDTGECRYEKITDADNCANYFTKPVTAVVMNHYFSYTHKVSTERARIAKCRSVIASQDVMGIAQGEPPGAMVSKL